MDVVDGDGVPESVPPISALEETSESGFAISMNTETTDVPQRSKEFNGKVVQITNVSPQATLQQMATLFGFLGTVTDISLYPTE